MSEQERAMTEQEWLAATDPRPMIEFVRARADDRLLRLFACACCRRVWHLLTDYRARRAVELAEGYTEGLTKAAELRRASVEASQADDDAGGFQVGLWAASWAADLSPGGTVAERAAHHSRESPECPAAQCVLLRDVVGDPFQPLRPRRFPAHVVGLAEAVWASFPAVSDQYGILADALDELGEEAAAAHCREAVHVKGCHVVDWVLAKRRARGRKRPGKKE